MPNNRREFLKTIAGGAGGAVLAPVSSRVEPGSFGGSSGGGASANIPVALVQCDSVPGQVQRNLDMLERRSEAAAKSGARWILFPELTVCDYVDKPGGVAEEVPEGQSTARVIEVARRLRAIIGFGLVEKARGGIYDTYVFVGPQGYLYHYRKTWLWYERADVSYRDEWARFDPGTGPELFRLDGIRATCFICADSNSKRCVERAAALRPQVVLFPINRGLASYGEYGALVRKIGAPTLVVNRVGRSVVKDTLGGSVVYSAAGEVVAKANLQGREEILHYNLKLAAS